MFKTIKKFITLSNLDVLECVYKADEFGLYGNSTEEYWSKLYPSLFDLTTWIREVSEWNQSLGSWDIIYNKTLDSKIFR